jgi:hypothetical protein
MMINAPPVRTTTYNTIQFTQNFVTIYWSYPFHIVFLEFLNKSYYLTVLEKAYNQSRTIIKTLESTDRCKHINEIFNDTIIKLHLLRRIKYYHLPCQIDSSLSCFYDDIHLCLCDYFGQQHRANCFEFDHHMKFNCLGQGSCENGAQCFQDNPTCPKTSCLHMDQWLNACVAIEQAIIAIQGTQFDKKKSKQTAKYLIFILVFLTISTAVHDPIHRRLLDDNDDGDIEKKRIWCIVTYSSHIQIYKSVMNILHFVIPFFINVISAFIIIKTKARQRATVQSDQTYNQFQQHRHLIIAPLLLVILAIPRLILTLASGCMTSVRDSWVFVTGYFISFIPSMLTCIVFVCPSKLYKDALRKAINIYRKTMQNILASFRSY